MKEPRCLESPRLVGNVGQWDEIRVKEDGMMIPVCPWKIDNFGLGELSPKINVGKDSIQFFS